MIHKATLLPQKYQNSPELPTNTIEPSTLTHCNPKKIPELPTINYFHGQTSFT